MGRIKPLAKNVYEKIAAGEVIDRPSAVIRELLDNSLDANSNNIKASFEKGGLDLISVSDDGMGIYYQDLEKAPLKHFTSKINSFDDIYSIKSMGFRGEALSSIASVARLKITSFNGEQEHGGELYAEAGNDYTIKPFVRKKGTTVEVRDLFFNVPARQKFTKSVSAESRSIKDVFIKKTLPFNNINVSLNNNDKPVIDVPSQTLLERIESYFPENIRGKDLLEIKNNRLGHIKITGYVSIPQVYYHNRSFQIIYVNKRPVVIPSLFYAISSAYEGLMPGNKHAFSFIFIEIDSGKIDINIHPAKKEIKFFDERVIFSLVKNSITESFKQGFPVQGLPDFTTGNNVKQGNELYSNDSSFSFTKNNANNIQDETPEQKTILFQHEEIPETQNYKNDTSFISGNEKILGILFDTYLAIQKNDDFFLVDYHAAHERINYEKLKSRFLGQTQQMEKQHLLTPLKFELSPAESAVIIEHLDLFDNLGYEISEFGDNEFIVNTVPAIKTYGHDLEVVQKLVNKFIVSKDFNNSNVLLDELLKIQSCRMSIKSGDNPPLQHFTGLLNKLISNGYELTCPHGRPLLIKMSKQELDKKFLRNI